MSVQYIRESGNEATDYCIVRGGSLQGAFDSNGMPYNFCVAPTCEKCESWSHYVGECVPTGTNVCPVPIIETIDEPQVAMEPNYIIGLTLLGIAVFGALWVHVMFGPKGISHR